MPIVLVADDNTNIQRMVALAFQDRGIDVISVGNGEAAVRRLPDLNPDLILADIFMPVRNGYELCEWVKKNPKYSHIPVVLLVGAFDPLDEKEARRVGSDGILKKPFIPPDPLIAMVTAILLKNPAIAEELARGKKEAAAPPPPPPAPAVLEIPARTAPKPLPEFPEPSPEEAEIAYSFGTGRRALDNEEEKPDEHPAPKADVDEEAEEAFDGTSTVNDWRRSAMQFEVSEEVAMRPAISSDENFDQVSPGERELSSTNVHVLDTPEPAEPLAQNEQDNETAELGATIAAASQATPADSAPEPEPRPEPTTAVTQHTEPELQEACETETGEIVPEPSFASKATHWMDMMSSTPGRPTGNWFSSVLASVEAVVERQESAALPVSSDPSCAEPLPNELASDDLLAAEMASAAPRTMEEPVAEAAIEPETEAQTAPVETMAAPTDEEDSFFANEPAEPEPATSAPSFAIAPASEPSKSEPLHQLEDEPTEAPASEQSVEPASEAASDHAKQTIEDETPEPMARASSEFDSGFFVEEPVPESSYKEPDLVEPPAVRVVPEPLLVDEVTQSAASIYDKHPEIVHALHFFALPSQEEPAAEEPAWEAIPARGESGNGSREFASGEYSEWTPTIAPPTREALADIPFLNPPADFHRNAASTDNDGPTKINSETVDAIVQRLLEKIEPQLHDLLSQGVLKPLVQSFLHSELEKKEK